MTIQEAIALADAQRPNQVDPKLKIRWLSELDGRVEHEILSPNGKSDFVGYPADVSFHTELKIPFPFDKIYATWIIMQVDLINGETAKYNNGADLCAELLEAFRRRHIRTTTSERVQVKYF